MSSAGADLDFDFDFDLDLEGAGSSAVWAAVSVSSTTSSLLALFLPFLPPFRFASHVAVCEKGRLARGRFQGAWLTPTAADAGVVRLRLGL